MNDIIEIYDKYNNLGIYNRKITEGKEIELVKEYIEYRKSIFKATKDKKLAIFLESKIGDKYPDIIFVEYNPNNYIKWNKARTKLSIKDYKVLYFINYSNGIKSKDIVRKLGFSWKDTMQSIENLYDANLLFRKNERWITYDNKINTHKIEAIEAKINNWNEVLQQSLLNRNFANESYALSITNKKVNNKIIDKFKTFGVGIYIKENEEFIKIENAQKSINPVSFYSILLNEWIGKILINKEGVHVN